MKKSNEIERRKASYGARGEKRTVKEGVSAVLELHDDAVERLLRRGDLEHVEDDGLVGTEHLTAVHGDEASSKEDEGEGRKVGNSGKSCELRRSKRSQGT
jgi:hypothetical protein